MLAYESIVLQKKNDKFFALGETEQSRLFSSCLKPPLVQPSSFSIQCQATSTCLPKEVCDTTINAFEQISRQLGSQLGSITGQLGSNFGGVASQVASQLESVVGQHGSQLGSIASLVDIKSLLPKVKCACIRSDLL